VRLTCPPRQALLPFSRPRPSSRREGRQAQIFPRTPTPGAVQAATREIGQLLADNQIYSRPAARLLYALQIATQEGERGRSASSSRPARHALSRSAAPEASPESTPRQNSLRKAPNRPGHRRGKQSALGSRRGTASSRAITAPKKARLQPLREPQPHRNQCFAAKSNAVK
jgi:hypothetical protein